MKFYVTLAHLVREETVIVVEAEDASKINVYAIYKAYEGNFEPDREWSPQFLTSSSLEGDADEGEESDVVVTRAGITYCPKTDKSNDVI